MINKRFLNIVKILLEQDNYITIDKISKQLNVSNKTIRNDLHQVESWITLQGLTLSKKTSVGIAINGDSKTKLNLLHIIQEKNKHNIEYSPEARKLYIGMKLLTNSHCRIFELADELYVSRATIHKDILNLEGVFLGYKIELHRKNNNGVVIKGSEKNKRKLLIDLMIQDNGYSIFSNIIKNPNYECDGSFPFASLDINDDEIKEFIEVLFSNPKSNLDSLPLPSLILFSLHFIIVYLRIKDNNTITLSEGFIQELSDYPFYNDIEELCSSIENHYKITFNKMEKHYLQVFLISLHSPLDDTKNNDDADLLTKKLISEWSKSIIFPIETDKKLYEVIFNHMLPAITRFKHGISLDNPLLDDIASIYPNTFSIVKKSIYIINDYYNCNVSDDEIGFFSLHLAASIDRLKSPLNVVVVSHSNIGATNLICEKLKMNFPEIRIKEVISFSTLNNYELKNIDLIISTIDLENNELNYIVINTILYNHDIFRLKSVIKTFYDKKNNPFKV